MVCVRFGVVVKKFNNAETTRVQQAQKGMHREEEEAPVFEEDDDETTCVGLSNGGLFDGFSR